MLVVLIMNTTIANKYAIFTLQLLELLIIANVFVAIFLPNRNEDTGIPIPNNNIVIHDAVPLS